MYLHESWSGDLIAGAISYLPKGTPASVLGYWYQAAGGPIFNDIVTVAAKAEKPVIAHRFLNYMMDNKAAYNNFVNYVGYQPPLNSITPDQLIKDEVVPENLRSALVTRDAYANGNAYLTLSVDGEREWDKVWNQFRSG